MFSDGKQVRTLFSGVTVAVVRTLSWKYTFRGAYIGKARQIFQRPHYLESLATPTFREVLLSTTLNCVLPFDLDSRQQPHLAKSL